MFDQVIVYVQGAMNYKSDIPVFLLFGAVIIYGLSKFNSKIWLALSISVVAIFAIFYPFFFIAPSFSKGMASMGLIGKEWLKDQEVARSIGIGFMVGIIFSIMLLYLIGSTIVEILKKTSGVYVLATKKEPKAKDYMKVSPNEISEYANADIVFLETKLFSTDITYIKNSFNDEKQIKTSMAWVCKGLPVSIAVRKTKFDCGDHAAISPFHSIA
ncbi:hypothetical protein [Paenibacillus sp. GP183]|uniref:hypothetical protein n=1 Tax=Paenibacillus sp. GP183 TaxID=1882751 RepID=UPI000899F6A5|nr:hypothetical protein [Paenibacillus sp. GP183]SED06095.1 hypothetical protein SAMN05443246_5535 [Paenibacillus sp. GP183]